MNLLHLTDITGNYMTCRLFNKRTYIIVFCIYLIAVGILCLMKPDNIPQVEKTFFGIPMDKVAHFLMFMPYPVLASMSFINRRQNTWRNIAVLSVILILGIGLAYGTEILQAHTGYRSYEVADLKADFIGMGTGGLLALTFIILQHLKK